MLLLVKKMQPPIIDLPAINLAVNQTAAGCHIYEPEAHKQDPLALRHKLSLALPMYSVETHLL